MFSLTCLIRIFLSWHTSIASHPLRMPIWEDSQLSVIPHEVPEDSRWILAYLLFPSLNNPSLKLSQWFSWSVYQEVTHWSWYPDAVSKVLCGRFYMPLFNWVTLGSRGTSPIALPCLPNWLSCQWVTPLASWETAPETEHGKIRICIFDNSVMLCSHSFWRAQGAGGKAGCVFLQITGSYEPSGTAGPSAGCSTSPASPRVKPWGTSLSEHSPPFCWSQWQTLLSPDKASEKNRK